MRNIRQRVYSIRNNRNFILFYMGSDKGTNPLIYIRGSEKRRRAGEGKGKASLRQQPAETSEQE